jgi:hypothetical protein
LLGFLPNFFYSVRYYNAIMPSDILQANMISDQRPQLNMQCDILVVGGGAAGLADSRTAAGMSASTEDDVGRVESGSFLNYFLTQGQDARWIVKRAVFRRATLAAALGRTVCLYH